MDSHNIASGQIVKRLAILNPYLQGGHVLIAETESAARYIEAARNLSIEARMFASIEELDEFDPDVVVAITYQEAKLTKYPTYVSLNAPPALLKDVPRFIRNLLSYDGFLTISSSVTAWLHELGKKYNKVMHIAHAAFSVPRMPFKPCNFTNASAMYMGTNWDGMRHHNFFQLFDSGEYLKCYGPAKSWAAYSKSLYGGEIPFDGSSVFNRYRQHGMGLCMGHPAFDKEGIANSRLFEIPASSALAVCSSNELTKSIYGDSVLYLNQNAPTKILADELIASVEWVRSNPGLAQEMARESHEIYNKNASMELYISNLLELHKKVVAENGYLPQDAAKVQTAAAKATPKVTFILPKLSTHSCHALLKDLAAQTYEHTHLVLLDHQEVLDPVALEILAGYGMNRVSFMPCDNDLGGAMIDAHLENIHTDWIGVLHFTDKLFPNHTALLLKEYARIEAENVKAAISVIAPDSLEFAYWHHLPEVITDDHLIYNQNRVRMAPQRDLPFLPLGSLLMKYKSVNRGVFTHGDTQSLRLTSFFSSLSEDMLLKCHEVTFAANIENIAVREGGQKLEQVKFDHNNNIDVEDILNYVQELKKKVWKQDRLINDICQSIQKIEITEDCDSCKHIKTIVPVMQHREEAVV